MDSTIETDVVRESFNALGCASEKFEEGYFVIDIPAQLSYGPVNALLNEMLLDDSIDYAEACLSEKHREEHRFKPRN